MNNLKILITMKRVTFILICLLFCCTMVSAQEKSELQKQAEAIFELYKNVEAADGICHHSLSVFRIF